MNVNCWIQIYVLDFINYTTCQLLKVCNVIGYSINFITSSRKPQHSFLPHDTMRKPGLCFCPVSVTFVHCIQTAKDIVKLLSWPSSPIILVFWPPTPVSNSKGNPFSRDAKYKGWEIFLRFLAEIAVCLRNGTRYAHGFCGTLIGNHRWQINTCQFWWFWVIPNPGFKSNISKTACLMDILTIENW